MPAPSFDLERYDVRALQHLAQVHGLDRSYRLKKADLARQLSQQFRRPEHLRKALLELNQLERAAIRLLQLGPEDGMSFWQFLFLAAELCVAALPTQPQVQLGAPSLPPLDRPSTRIQDVPARLCALGLAVPWRAQQTSPQGAWPTPTTFKLDAITNLALPAHVRQALPPVQFEFQTVVEDSLARIEPGSARSFQRNLYLYWSLARRQPLQVKQTGHLYKRDFRLVNASLIEPKAKLGDESQYPDLLFLRVAGMALGLFATYDGSTLVAAEDRQAAAVSQTSDISPQAPPFFQADPATRVRQAFESWRDQGWWRPATADMYQDEMQNRAAFARLVREFLTFMAAPPSAWIKIESLLPAVWPKISHLLDYYASHSFYAFADSLTMALRQINFNRPQLRTLAPGLIEHLLTGPLHWMGLVDLGFDEKGNLRAYRLTAAGAFALGVSERMEVPAQEGQVVVQPNFHILAIDPLPDATLETIYTFAERKKVGRVVDYELTRASVHRAALNGWPVARVIAWLDEVTRHELPANVLRTLQEWGEEHRRIRFLQPSMLFEAATPAELEDLVAAAPAALGRRLTPPTALVADADALRHALSNAGRMLISSDAGDVALKPHFRLGEDGRLQALYAVLSMAASAQVAGLAELRDQDLYLTRRSLRAAIAGGWNVDRIVATLNKALVEPLSATWQKRIKTWAAHFGQARTSSRAFLELRDAEILAELRQDPQIARLLKPFQAAGALATYDPGDRQQLADLLAEYGVELHDDLA